jgi:hypothetical protein
MAKRRSTICENGENDGERALVSRAQSESATMRISRNSKPRDAGRQHTAAQAVLPTGRRLQQSTQPYARKNPRGEIKSCVGRRLVEFGVLPKWLGMGLRDSFSSPRRNNSSCTRKGGCNARAIFSGFRKDSGAPLRRRGRIICRMIAIPPKPKPLRVDKSSADIAQFPYE